MKIRLLGVEMAVQSRIGYLGVILEANRNCTAQIAKAAKGAKRVLGLICGLLRNVGGPSTGRRRLLASAAISKLMYAAPTWAEGTGTAWNRNRLQQVTRLASLRICRGYRTISGVAAHVLAGVPPAHLLVQEAREVYEASRQAGEGRPVGRTDRRTARERARAETMRRWQSEWEEEENVGCWTRRLIPNVQQWTGRQQGELSFELTQLLSGHGCFDQFLKRIGKAEAATCGDCPTGEEDTAEHTLFVCPAWESQREAWRAAWGGNPTVELLVEGMTEDPEKWAGTSRFATEVIQEKARRQRERQRSNLRVERRVRRTSGITRREGQVTPCGCRNNRCTATIRFRCSNSEKEIPGKRRGFEVVF